jgi:glycine cleavage system H protein
MSEREHEQPEQAAGGKAGPAPTVFYRRSRFATRLPVDRLYTPAHYWLVEEEPGVWRVGLTGFATRMLGDLVEYGFSVKPGAAISVGQTIGWLEGFKAIADLYSVARGEFLGANEALAGDITLVESEPYKRGWLYRVRGEPADPRLDVQGYVELLDTTIDAMLRDRHKAGGGEGAGGDEGAGEGDGGETHDDES